MERDNLVNPGGQRALSTSHCLFLCAMCDVSRLLCYQIPAQSHGIAWSAHGFWFVVLASF